MEDLSLKFGTLSHHPAEVAVCWPKAVPIASRAMQDSRRDASEQPVVPGTADVFVCFFVSDVICAWLDVFASSPTRVSLLTQMQVLLCK